MLLAGNKTGSNDVTGGVALSKGAVLSKGVVLSKGAALDSSVDPVGDSSLIWLAK